MKHDSTYTKKDPGRIAKQGRVKSQTDTKRNSMVNWSFKSKSVD